MKKTAIAITLTTMVLGGCASTNSGLDPRKMTIGKQLVSMDRAVVLMADAVQVEPSKLNAGTAAGGALIAAGASTAVYSNSRASYNAAGAMAVVGLATMLISAANNAPVDAIRYTVQVMKTERLDEVVQVVPEGGMPFAPNTPVLLKNYSDGTRYIFADRTQGMTYSKAVATSFEGDAEAKAQADAARRAELVELKGREKFLWDQSKKRIMAGTSIQETNAARHGDKIDAAIRSSDNTTQTIIIK